MYGHVERLAKEIKDGASSVEGVEAKLWQVLRQSANNPFGVKMLKRTPAKASATYSASA